MRCAEIEHELGCLIDDELAAPERREVENHLAVCQGCRELVSEQRQLKQQLRQNLAKPATDVLTERLSRSLDREDSRRRWARLRPLAATLVSVVLPIGAALALVLGYVQTVEPLITDSLVKQVQSWFDGKVPFAVPALRLEPLASLRGGRLCNLGNRDAAMLQYEQGGRKISVFVFDAQGLHLRAQNRRMIGNREVFIDRASGYQVAVFRDRELGYAIAGNVGEPEFVRLVSAAVGQPP
jgi:anti-sigma factor RsiW